MDKEKYSVINNYLNDYLNYLSDSFFSFNLRKIYFLSDDVYKTTSKLKININEMNIPLDGCTTFRIVNDFLDSLNPKYKKSFNESLRDGSINIIMAEENDYVTNIPGSNKYNNDFHKKSKDSFAGIKDEHKNVNVYMYHNYLDPSTIIHEFFHSQNVNDKNIMTTSETRELLTETISIYFENLLNDSLVEDGYDKQEIDQLHIRRIKNTNVGAFITSKLVRLLYVYDKYGNLDEKTYNLKDEFNDLVLWNNKEDYYNDINFLYSLLKDKDIKKANPFATFGYVIGGLISYNLLKDKLNIKKMEYINDNVQNMSVYNVLEKLNIKLENENDYNMLFCGLKEKIKELNFQKEVSKKK